MVNKPILYFEDAIGVTPRYRKAFEDLSHNLAQNVSLYRMFDKRDLLLWKGNRKQPGYRLDHTSITKVQNAAVELIKRYEPVAVVTSDPATLGLLMPYREESWDWATIENLRGGVYRFWGIPWIVTYPLTALYTEVRERDVALANDGFSNEEEFVEAKRQLTLAIADDTVEIEVENESRDNDDAIDEGSTGETTLSFEQPEPDESTNDRDSHFYTPVLTRVSVGQFCLAADWHKAFRVVEAEQRRIQKLQQ